MDETSDGDDVARRRELRREFTGGASRGRPEVLHRLLACGGVLLSNDEELLAHIDFWLAHDPVVPPLADVLGRHVEASPLERDALVTRGRSGRIRDRVRAAQMLGRFAAVDEDAHACLIGLARDPVPSVWRAAARSAWRHAAAQAPLRRHFARCLATQGLEDDSTALRRHLAGGLAGLVPAEAGLAAALIDETLAHPDVWTRAAAALSCGECVVLAPDDARLAPLFVRCLDAADLELPASLATGLRDAGRPAGRRAFARKRAADLEAALAQRRPESADDWLAHEQARGRLDSLFAEERAACAAGTGIQARLELLLLSAAEATPRRAPAGPALAEVLDAACRAVDEARRDVDAGDKATRSRGAALFRELTERLLGEDRLGPLIDVVPQGAAERKAARQALRRLERRLVDAARAMAESPHFLPQREGLQALALAMDAHVHRLRDAAGLFVDKAQTSRSRRQACGALARLLDRLRLDDPDGFLDVALRLALQPERVRTHVLTRVASLSPEPSTRSLLAMLERTSGDLRAGLPPSLAAERMERLLRGGAATAGAGAGTTGRTGSPAVQALADVASSLRHLGGDRGGGSLRGLPEAVGQLARCELSLPWGAELPPAVEEAAALCRGLADSPTPRRLRHLADRLEGALSSAAAAALVHALRKAAKSPPPRPRRATGPQAAISPGDVLHGYRVTEVLPPSNFSVVCMAVRVDTHRRVVLKVPTPSTWEQPEARELFLREGHLLQVLPAEHVVRVEELFEDGPPMLVIQHLRGRTLDQHMGMDRAWLLRRCLDVLRGLRLVHDADIVHRDLKPSNVMIVPSGRAVLIDFGVAYVPPEIVGAPLGGLELMLGTPPYMAPEQWKGYRPVPATDIYALGAMTYEILAGRTPFTCASYAAYRDAHLEAEPPPLGAAAPSLLADTVLRMLAKDPEDRPPHAEVREAIEDALAQGVLVPPGGA